MKLIFETLKIKHKNITSYHLRTNETIKKFNNVLDYILTKYCIDELIKNWNLYLNQTLFVTRIRTHIIIDFFLFYLLYEINSNLLDDVENSISNRYDERIDLISFLSRDKIETFKKIMTRVMKNKVVWNSKIKKKSFSSRDIILIKIKKFKKFEMNWYKLYEMIRSEILNIYVFKSLESFSNKYLINDDKIKMINVNEKIIKDWRMSRDRERFAKQKTMQLIESNDVAFANEVIIKRKRDRSRKIDVSIDSNVDYKSSSQNELDEDLDDIVWKL